MVICDHSGKKCPKKCTHRVKHEPLYDHYEGGEGTCDKIESMCGWTEGNNLCVCIETEEKE